MLAFVTQPLVVLIAAIAFFIGRTILHARNLKAAAKDPELAKVITAGHGQNLLKAHEESLKQARTQTKESLAQARSAMNVYTRDFKRSKQKKS